MAIASCTASRSGSGRLIMPLRKRLAGGERRGACLGGRGWTKPPSIAVACPNSVARAGLSTVDHIAQSMPYEEMLRWLLFYRSILDVEKLAPVDVVDPGGLVRSQVLQSPNGRLRLPLNAPHQGQSLTARFLADYMDAGV